MVFGDKNAFMRGVFVGEPWGVPSEHSFASVLSCVGLNIRIRGNQSRKLAQSVVDLSYLVRCSIRVSF